MHKKIPGKPRGLGLPDILLYGAFPKLGVPFSIHGFPNNGEYLFGEYLEKRGPLQTL